MDVSILAPLLLARHHPLTHLVPLLLSSPRFLSLSLPTVPRLGSSSVGKQEKIKLERARGMYEQKLNTFLTCPCLVDFAADVCLVHVVFAPSPTAYLLLVIAVGLRVRRERRRIVRDDVGELSRK